MDNNKEKIQSIPKNLKINTRIVITSVLAIVIPTIIIAAFAAVLLISEANKTHISSASYNLVMQIQWNQAASDIAELLEENSDADKKLQQAEKTCKEFEKNGAEIYISENGNDFYSSSDGISQKAQEISDYSTDSNSYYIGRNGLVISGSVAQGDTLYRFVIVNDNISLPDFANDSLKSIMGSLINKTTIIIAVIVLLFIITIIIISFITSKTIINPIKQITEGANEIAKGNFEHEIKYKSTNELGMLSESFNEMRLRVKESIEEQSLADKKHKEMIAGIAHDLRTPLTSVKGYLEGLRDGIADTPEKQKRYMDIIYSSTCDTEKMLDELLTISKLEIGSVNLNCEEVKISDFIAFADEMKDELEKNDFDLDIFDKTENEIILNLDTDSFSRVIQNIVSNSIKYRIKDIRGKISLTVLEYQNTVLFEIKDNGMGIDRESLPRIFDPLYRADKARTNVRNGSGLGLAICKQIVEMHGGLIWAQSEIGKGLSIFISLPIFKKEQL